MEKKGNRYLIEACAALRDQGIDFRCTIAGDGPLAATLQQQVTERELDGIVNVTGQAILQEDLAAFMRSGDIFVQPCVWSSDNDVDGTPRTLMEAMASGVPCVASRLAGIPDIIEHDATGLLVPPEDGRALANAIARLLDDPELRRRVAENGRRHIERQFRLPDCVAPLERKFREIMADLENVRVDSITPQAHREAE